MLSIPNKRRRSRHQLDLLLERRMSEAEIGKVYIVMITGRGRRFMLNPMERIQKHKRMTRQNRLRLIKLTFRSW